LDKILLIRASRMVWKIYCVSLLEYNYNFNSRLWRFDTSTY